MKQAVILAAGEGRRLKPFTVNKPKAMLSIAGKPIIRYVLESLVENGIRDIIVITGYHQEQIFDYIGDGRQFGVEVNFVSQNKQLGTSHALAQAKGATDSEFLVLAGDKLITPETISPLIELKEPAILVKRKSNPSSYGVVTIENGHLTSISEKPTRPESNIINTGIYTFNSSDFRYLETELDIPDALNSMLLDGRNIHALETTGTWLDIIYPWDILSLNAEILQKIYAIHNGIIESNVTLNGKVSIGKGTIIRANTYITGPVVIGNGCEIGPDVCISPATSIADNVVISPFTEIKNSVIGNDVHIASGSAVHDSIIDRGSLIGGHFCSYSEETEITIDSENHKVKIGSIVGEGCNLGNCIVAQPGALVGNYCQVRSLKVINGRIPDKSLVV